jgi:CheY-like chemotaxis protein
MNPSWSWMTNPWYKLIQLILEGEGYHVLVAANATEALQAV